MAGELTPLQLLLTMQSTLGPQLQEASAQIEAFGAKVGVSSNAAAASIGKVGTAIEGVGMLASLGPMAALIAAMAALGAITGAVSSNFEHLHAMATTAQELENLSSRSGVATSQLQGLQKQMEDLKIPAEALPVALRFLQKNLVDGKTSFEGFTITAKDTRGALMQLADQFEKMPAGPDKTRMALEFLGARSGQTLIPLMNEGAKAIEGETDKLKALGVVMDDASTNRLAHLSQMQEQTNEHWEGMRNKIAVALLPVMEAWLPILSGVADSLAKMATAITNFMHAADSMPGWQRALILMAAGGSPADVFTVAFEKGRQESGPYDPRTYGPQMSGGGGASQAGVDARGWMNVMGGSAGTGSLRPWDAQASLEVMAKVQKWLVDVKVPATQLSQAGQYMEDRFMLASRMTRASADGIVTSVQQSIQGLVTGTETLGQAFDSLITGIMQKIAEAALSQGIGIGMEALGFVIGGPVGGFLGDVGGKLAGGASAGPSVHNTINVNALSAKDMIRSASSPSGEINQMNWQFYYASRLP